MPDVRAFAKLASEELLCVAARARKEVFPPKTSQIKTGEHASYLTHALISRQLCRLH
jgi:hypothetical protein